VATLQALRHGDAASLWRVYLGVAPACVLALFVARPFATLILQTVNQLSSSAANTVIERQAELTSALTSVATAARPSPLRAGRRGRDRVVALVVRIDRRAVILTLLLVLVPVIVPLATFPAGRRLAGAWRDIPRRRREQVPHRDYSDPGFSELLGDSATQVITGALTLILASFSPFLLLKVIPFVETAALHNLEGSSAPHQDDDNIPSSPLAQAARAMARKHLQRTRRGPTISDSHVGGRSGDARARGDGSEVAAAVGTPTPRGGHVAYRTDEMGPVVGWHFDE